MGTERRPLSTTSLSPKLANHDCSPTLVAATAPADAAPEREKKEDYPWTRTHFLHSPLFFPPPFPDEPRFPPYKKISWCIPHLLLLLCTALQNGDERAGRGSNFLFFSVLSRFRHLFPWPQSLVHERDTKFPSSARHHFANRSGRYRKRVAIKPRVQENLLAFSPEILPRQSEIFTNNFL